MRLRIALAEVMGMKDRDGVGDLTKLLLQGLYRRYAEAVRIERAIAEEEARIKSEVDEDEHLREAAEAFSTWRCIWKPMMAVREERSLTSRVVGTVRYGEVLEVVGEPVDGWVRLRDGNFAAVQTDNTGPLMKLVAKRTAREEIAFRKDARTKRFMALMNKQAALLRSCDIQGGDQLTAGATDLLISKMRTTERGLEWFVGRAKAWEVLQELVVEPSCAADGSELFTCDWLGTGRGACERCWRCPCYQWTPSTGGSRRQDDWYLNDPLALRCQFCFCKNTDHKHLGAKLGPPGYGQAPPPAPVACEPSPVVAAKEIEDLKQKREDILRKTAALKAERETDSAYLEAHISRKAADLLDLQRHAAELLSLEERKQHPASC